uniref:Uncharacterized protein n=1 Tax=viral metagenome TaxID=1070528 RepID=A0A6C0JVV3_9ZZZZ
MKQIFAYKELYNKHPNTYDYLYYNIPTQSFCEKDGIIQKVFPHSHLYYPNIERIIDKKELIYPFNGYHGKFGYY